MQIVLGSKFPKLVDFTPQTWGEGVKPITNWTKVEVGSDGLLYYSCSGASNFKWMVLGSDEGHGMQNTIWGYKFKFPDRAPLEQDLKRFYVQDVTWECSKDDSRGINCAVRLSKPMVLDRVLYNGRFQQCAIAGIAVTCEELTFWSVSGDPVIPISSTEYAVSKGERPYYDDICVIDSANVESILRGSCPKGMVNTLVSISGCEIGEEVMKYKVGVLQGKQQFKPEVIEFWSGSDTKMTVSYEEKWCKYTLTAVELLHLYVITSIII